MTKSIHSFYIPVLVYKNSVGFWGNLMVFWGFIYIIPSNNLKIRKLRRTIFSHEMHIILLIIIF